MVINKSDFDSFIKSIQSVLDLLKVTKASMEQLKKPKYTNSILQKFDVFINNHTSLSKKNKIELISNLEKICYNNKFEQIRLFFDEKQVSINDFKNISCLLFTQTYADKQILNYKNFFYNLKVNIKNSSVLDSTVITVKLYKKIWNNFLIMTTSQALRKNSINNLLDLVSLVKFTKNTSLKYKKFIGLFPSIFNSNLHSLFLDILFEYIAFNYQLHQFYDIPKKREEPKKESSTFVVVQNQKESSLKSSFKSDTSDNLLIQKSNESLSVSYISSEEDIFETNKQSPSTNTELSYLNRKNIKSVEADLYQNSRQKHQHLFVIDWKVLVEILILVDKQNRSSTREFFDFERVYKTVWGPIFDNFFQADSQMITSFIEKNDYAFDIGADDLESYTSGSAFVETIETSPKHMKRLEKYLKDFELQKCLNPQANCLYDFYMEHHGNTCCEAKSFSKANYFTCAFCDFSFCSQCFGESLSRDTFLFLKLRKSFS